MKLGMPLRTSILRRLVSKNPIRANKLWDIADFVTSPPAILVRKKDKCLKIRQKYVCVANYKKTTQMIVHEQF